MPRLKSRTRFPPYNFQIMLPEVGMKTAITGSFEEVVTAFAKIVKQNPALAQKYGWPSNRKGQEDFVDEREAQRMISHGWVDFVDQGPPLVYAPAPDSGKKNWRGAAAAVVNKGKAAFAAYTTLYGAKGPVARELAESRAKVCAACPQNDVTSGLSSVFVESTAKGILALLGALKDLDISTSVDDKLGVCKACSCPTRAKVYCPIEVIVEHTTPEVKGALDVSCWIRSEAGITA